jgi:uncharacterized protein (DUF1778 family)
VKLVEGTRERAMEILLGQRLFHLGAHESQALAGMLSNPPAPPDAQRSLLKSRADWE